MPVSLYIVQLLLYTPWSSCVSLYLSSYHIVICAESQINLQTCILYPPWRHVTYPTHQPLITTNSICVHVYDCKYVCCYSAIKKKFVSWQVNQYLFYFHVVPLVCKYMLLNVRGCLNMIPYFTQQSLPGQGVND